MSEVETEVLSDTPRTDAAKAEGPERLEAVSRELERQVAFAEDRDAASFRTLRLLARGLERSEAALLSSADALGRAGNEVAAAYARQAAGLAADCLAETEGE